MRARVLLLAISVATFINFKYNPSFLSSLSGKWRSRERSSIRLEDGTLDLVSDAIREGFQRDVQDFDDHLDDVARDFFNEQLNDKLDAAA